MFFKPEARKAVTPLGGKNRGAALPEKWELRISYRAECKVSGVWGTFTRNKVESLPQIYYENGILDSVWNFVQDKYDCGIEFAVVKVKAGKILYEKLAGAIETFCIDEAQTAGERVAPYSMLIYDQGDFCFDKQIDHPDEQVVRAEIQKILDKAKAIVDGRVYTYCAIFDYIDNGVFVSFPDLPGCTARGGIADDAFWAAKDALVEYFAEKGEAIRKNGALPVPTPEEELSSNGDNLVYPIEVVLNK